MIPVIHILFIATERLEGKGMLFFRCDLQLGSGGPDIVMVSAFGWSEDRFKSRNREQQVRAIQPEH